MRTLLNFFAKHEETVVLSTILFTAFLLRIINLNYNAPFGDEAMYVVIGEMGIFVGDWVSYNASSWLSGSQFLYPTLSAVMYSINGIWASRLLSVMAGLVLTFITYLLAKEFFGKEKGNTRAGLISAALVATATTSLYVSRLATMDTLSYVLFFLSVLFLQQAITEKALSGQKFFLSIVLLIISSLIKYSTIFYIPLLLAYGFFATKDKKRHLFISYYFFPLFITFSIYFLFNTKSTMDFILLQAGRGLVELSQIWNTIWQGWKYLLPLSLVGTVYTAFRISWKPWLFLFLGAMWMVPIHVVTSRVATLDKHLLFGIVFLALLAGIGVSSQISKITSNLYYRFAILLVVIYISLFAVESYRDLSYFNTLWTNSSKANSFLANQVSRNDKILTETGPATILEIFPIVDIHNMSTFNYLVYGQFEGERAYQEAVKDGYFKYIQLEANTLPKSEEVKKMHTIIVDNMDSNYEKIYDDNKIKIYRRLY